MGAAAIAERGVAGVGAALPYSMARGGLWSKEMRICPIGVCASRQRIGQVILWAESLLHVRAGQPVEVNWLDYRQVGVLSGIEIENGVALAWLD